MTLWCCYGNHLCTRDAIQSMGTTWISRKQTHLRRHGEASTTRLQRRRTSRLASPGVVFPETFTHTCSSSWCLFWLFSVILQIQNLKEGESYVFRVRAQNKAGVGKTSDVTEPVPALTKPGRRKGSRDVQRASWEQGLHIFKLLVAGNVGAG